MIDHGWLPWRPAAGACLRTPGESGANLVPVLPLLGAFPILTAMVPGDLLGRDDERKRLLAVCRDGVEPRCVLLSGEPGIGKTALLDVVAAEAQQAGCTVLRGAGVQAEQNLPYAGLQQLFAPLLTDLPDLPAPQRSALGVALGMATGATPETFLVAMGCLGLLVRVSETCRLVLLVDDVAWLDALSLSVVAFLGRRLDERMALIAAARSGEEEGPLRYAGAVVELGPLDDGAARGLLDGVAPSADALTRRRILRQARGNPLALVELPKLVAVGAPVPDDVAPIPMTRVLEQAFAGQINALRAPAREVITVAACYAGDDLPTILDAAARLALEPIMAADLDPAVAARLVEVSESTLRFRHPLVRSAIVSLQTPTRRVAAHAALAAALHRDPCLRAWHQANAAVGADDNAADDLAAAADLLAARGSTNQSVVFLERAAVLTTDLGLRGHRLIAAADRALGSGRAELVEGLVAQARALPFSARDRLRLSLIGEVLDEGKPGDARRVWRLCALASDAGELGDPDLALDLLLAAAVHCWWSDPGAAVRQRVVDTLGTFGHRWRDARFVAAMAVAEPVEAAAAVGALLGGFDPTAVEDGQTLRLLGLAAYAVGDCPRAHDFLGRAESRLRAGGQIGALIQVLITQIGVGLFTGDWAGAAARIDEARQFGDEIGQPVWDTGLLLGRAHLAALCGDLTDALDLAGQAELSAESARTNNLLAGVQLVRGTAWAAAGRHEESFAELRRLFDPEAPCYHVRQSYPGILFLAEAARHTPGHRDEARAVLDRFAALAATTPAPDLQVHLSAAQALLADGPDPENAYRDALAAGVSRWPFVRAMVEFGYGTWLRRQRRPIDARRPTRSALATFEQLGARGWAARARSGLAAAGERPSNPVRPLHEVLTPQQFQIAGLAARGLSNREIGEQLFLSPRTVGSHLYRIFPKIGVTSRIQLVEWLRAARPDQPGAVAPPPAGTRSPTGDPRPPVRRSSQVE